jgi:hypothetical protein
VKTLPYINDVTTDTSNPPQFSPSKIYESHFAELQRVGYPDLQPLQLEVPPGSRVDVRSKSRVGRSDLGANARRIRGFLAALK